MRVVVTGATGNVGSRLVRALAADPAVDEVVGVARRLPELEVDGVRWAAADVAEDDLGPVLAGADAVVHLAWLIQPAHHIDVQWRTNVVGSTRLLEAAAAARVGAVVHASSLAAYSGGPKDPPVDESWPTDGVPTLGYSRQKAYVERVLDAFEARTPEVRVVRLRPGLVLQRDAGAEISQLFLGPLVPGWLLRRGLPVVPRIAGLRFQAAHSADVAEAFRLATVGDVRGAFNVAADPVLDADALGRVLGGRPVPVPAAAARALADLSFRLHLQPTDPGWLDMVLASPLMDTTRAREELGWSPVHSAEDALGELVGGIADDATAPTPPLEGAVSR